jgi:hypothetical protein
MLRAADDPYAVEELHGREREVPARRWTPAGPEHRSNPSPGPACVETLAGEGRADALDFATTTGFV